MKQLFWATALVLAVGVGQAQATPITGGVNFGMDASPNTGSWATATGVDFTPDYPALGTSSVTSGNGSYAGTAGTHASFQDFSFAPLSPSPVNPLWEFSFGGRTYTFRLEAITLNQFAANARILEGTGTLFISGPGPTYDPTPSEWLFSGQGRNGQFSVSATNLVVTPDGGATLMLLGGALVGIGALRRRFKA